MAILLNYVIIIMCSVNTNIAALGYAIHWAMASQRFQHLQTHVNALVQDQSKQYSKN